MMMTVVVVNKWDDNNIQKNSVQWVLVLKPAMMMMMMMMMMFIVMIDDNDCNNFSSSCRIVGTRTTQLEIHQTVMMTMFQRSSRGILWMRRLVKQTPWMQSLYFTVCCCCYYYCHIVFIVVIVIFNCWWILIQLNSTIESFQRNESSILPDNFSEFLKWNQNAVIRSRPWTLSSSPTPPLTSAEFLVGISRD